jgi:hypothetical protein
MARSRREVTKFPRLSDSINELSETGSYPNLNRESSPNRRKGSHARKFTVWGMIGAASIGAAAYLGLGNSNPVVRDAAPNAQGDSQPAASNTPETQKPTEALPSPIYVQSDDPQTLLNGIFKNEENALNTGDKKYLALEVTSMDDAVYNEKAKLLAANVNYRQSHPGWHIRYSVTAVSPTSAFPVVTPVSGPRTIAADIVEKQYMSTDETSPYATNEYLVDITLTQSVRNTSDPEAVIDSSNMTYVWGISEMSAPIKK